MDHPRDWKDSSRVKGSFVNILRRCDKGVGEQDFFSDKVNPRELAIFSNRKSKHE